MLLNIKVVHLLKMVPYETVSENGGAKGKSSYCNNVMIVVLLAVGAVATATSVVLIDMGNPSSGANSTSESATEDTAGDLPVYVIPMNPEESPSGRRGLSQHAIFTWTSTCPKSTMKCMDTGGSWVDLSQFYEFSFLVGFGYDRLFGDCSGGLPFVSPYAISHAGGLYMDQYEHMGQDMKSGIESYRSGVGVASFDDVKHSGAYAATCGTKGYLEDPDHYTCGLQYITMGATFPGKYCNMLRTATGTSRIKPSSSGEYQFVFNQTAGLGDKYSEIAQECTWNPGKLPLFDGIKKMARISLKSAFLTFEVPLILPAEQPEDPNQNARGPSLDQFKFLSGNDDLTSQCQMDITVAIGTPSCSQNYLAVKVPSAKFEDQMGAKDVSKYKGLEKYGFEYNKSNNIWHRRGVEGCGLGCCDECFQWYCPIYKTGRGGDTNVPDRCKQYTYDCSKDWLGFTNSSEMVCGVPPLIDVNDEYTPRYRC